MPAVTLSHREVPKYHVEARWPTVAEYLAPLLSDLRMTLDDCNLGHRAAERCEEDEVAAEVVKAALTIRPFKHLAVDTLYIGVHPDWELLGDDQINLAYKWLAELKQRPNIAIAWNPWYTGSLDHNDIRVNVPDRDAPRYPAFRCKVHDFEIAANEAIGDRFCYWPRYEPFQGGFVDARREIDRDFLQARFNVRPTQHLVDSNRTTLFKRIFVFGQHPSSCAAAQAGDYRLCDVTVILDQLGFFPSLSSFEDWVECKWRT